MTTMDFNTRLVVALLMTMVLGLVLLVATADSAHAAELGRVVKDIDLYIPRGV